jgi:transcriptional regulator with XRE-family HTH domain
MSDSVKRDTTNVGQRATEIKTLRGEVSAWLESVVLGEGDRTVGAKVGVAHTTIRAMRRETQDPTQATIDKIAAAYGVPAPRIGLIFDDAGETVFAVRQRMAQQLREMAETLYAATTPPDPPAPGE